MRKILLLTSAVAALLVSSVAYSIPTSTVTTAVTVKGLEELKISYQAQKRVFVPRSTYIEGRYASDNSVLEIQLNDLSRAQFDQLVQKFPGNNSPPKFETKKSYRLEEFLPPMVRAVIGRQFRPISESFKWPVVENLDDSMDIDDLNRFADANISLSTLINCWTTAYEFLRTWRTGDNTISITWLSRTQADYMLTEEYLRPILKSETLKFGDILVFKAYDDGPGMDIVQHVAVYILPGLYFEKTDSTQDDAFRFVAESDLMNKFTDIFGKGLKTGHYRLKDGAVLPKISETNNLKAAFGDVFTPYFSETDLTTISFEFDWEPSMGGISKPRNYPYRLHNIKFFKKGDSIVLDPGSPILGNFQLPKF